MKIKSLLLGIGIFASMLSLRCSQQVDVTSQPEEGLLVNSPAAVVVVGEQPHESPDGSPSGTDVPSAIPWLDVKVKNFYISLTLGEDISVELSRELVPQETLDVKIVQGTVERSFHLDRVSTVGTIPVEDKIRLTAADLSGFSAGLAQIVFTRKVGNYDVSPPAHTIYLW